VGLTSEFNEVVTRTNRKLYKTPYIPILHDNKPWLYNDENEFYASHGYDDDGLGLHCVKNHHPRTGGMLLIATLHSGS